MDQNRRRFLRKVPDDIAFIQIERDEVGKVLNISEGGLSFSSITPVPRNLPVYFWFSFNLKDRIEAMGEVTWTDISRTIGGLKFTQLSQSNREVIQKWVSRLRREDPPEEIESAEEEIPESEEESLVSQLVAVGPPEPFRTKRLAIPAKSNGLDRVARFVSKARAHKPVSFFGGKIAEGPKPAPAVQVRATASALGTAVIGTTALAIEPPKLLPERPMFSMDAGPAPTMASIPSVDAKSSSFDAKSSSFSSSFSFRGLESLIELVPLQRHLSAKKRQLVCGVLLGIGISALVTLPALKFWNSRAHAETIKPTLTDSSTPTNSVATQPLASDPATASAAKPTYPSAGIFSDPNPVPLPTKGTTSSFASRTHLPASYWKEVRGEPSKTTSVKTQKRPTAKASSASTTADRKSGLNPTQLWSEVQVGNTKAAVELAELYIKGNGVPRNCQQARVLLLMASEKRNTAAIKRLHDLDQGAACP